MSAKNNRAGSESEDRDLAQGKKRRALGRIVDEDAPIFRSARVRSKPRPASRELGLELEKKTD